MNRYRMLVTLTFFVLVGRTVRADVSVVVLNPDFSSPVITCSNYSYQSPVPCGGTSPFYPTQNYNNDPSFGWTFEDPGGNGLTVAGSPFNPPSFAPLSPGSQAVFLQSDVAFVKQTLTGPAGNWTVNFYLGSRYAAGSYDGNQTVKVLLDNIVVGTYALSSYTPFTAESTGPVALGAGNHTLEFLGTAPGDHTAFLSDVSVSVPEPSILALLAANLVGIGLFLRSRRRA